MSSICNIIVSHLDRPARQVGDAVKSYAREAVWCIPESSHAALKPRLVDPSASQELIERAKCAHTPQSLFDIEAAPARETQTRFA